MNSIISCRNLHKSFKAGTSVQHVLKGVDFSVGEHEMVSILGPSGAGKSTLLHILGLLDKPDTGEVFFKGKRADNLPPGPKARIRNREIGFVFQFYHLLPELTALQNVLLSGMMSHSLTGWLIKRKDMIKRGENLLERMGMGPHMHKRPSKLSGGERQRVAIARALFSSPQVVFCDEPTGNLDTETAKEIMNLIMEYRDEHGIAFVIVTHNEAVADMASRKGLLVDGKMQEMESTKHEDIVIPDVE